ncbi:hypothetical protein EVAR_37053_1 [Eumeta japonica]|uniref:Uncharacterized protein n=1 Tax=Eumeta variegata TaxID=151549 RepID=A0A4C1WF36_EUMVA|nr:hypothetical protein EVAR_37053_1 [Eumeta japonica]
MGYFTSIRIQQAPSDLSEAHSYQKIYDRRTPKDLDLARDVNYRTDVQPRSGEEETRQAKKGRGGARGHSACRAVGSRTRRLRRAGTCGSWHQSLRRLDEKCRM